jgi:hypothetical protein
MYSALFLIDACDGAMIFLELASTVAITAIIIHLTHVPLTKPRIEIENGIGKRTAAMSVEGASSAVQAYWMREGVHPCRSQPAAPVHR